MTTQKKSKSLRSSVESLNSILDSISNKFKDCRPDFHARAVKFKFPEQISNLIVNKIGIKCASGGKSLGFTNGNSNNQDKRNQKIISGQEFPPEI